MSKTLEDITIKPIPIITKISSFVLTSQSVMIRLSGDRIIIFNEHLTTGLTFIVSSFSDMKKIVDHIRNIGKFIVWEIFGDITSYIYDCNISVMMKWRRQCMQPFDSVEIILINSETETLQNINDLVTSIMVDISLRTINLYFGDLIEESSKEEIIEYYKQICENTRTYLVCK